MIRWLYEQSLLCGITILPTSVCFMITEGDMRDAPHKLAEVTRWCHDTSEKVSSRAARSRSVMKNHKVGIENVTFHISTQDPEQIIPYLSDIEKISGFARLHLHIGDRDEVSGSGRDIWVAIGKSGRDEIVDCIKKMAELDLLPENVDEQTIEQYLTFHYTPDLVIKTGGSHLTDFLIWQSVYSELFFSDVNWKWFRKVDFLRALRDYQARARRFGR